MRSENNPKIHPTMGSWYIVLLNTSKVIGTNKGFK